MRISPRHIFFTLFVCSLFSVPNLGCGGPQPTNVTDGADEAELEKYRKMREEVAANGE